MIMHQTALNDDQHAYTHRTLFDLWSLVQKKDEQNLGSYNWNIVQFDLSILFSAVQDLHVEASKSDFII